MEQVASLTAHLRPSPRWHDEVQTHIQSSSRKSRRRSWLQTAHAVSGTKMEAHGVRLQVERQTHLPANRQEAWEALQMLLPSTLWEKHAPVFAALESIYRAECQQLGEELQAAYRAANEAVEEIPPAGDDSRASQAQSPDDSRDVTEPAVDAFRNDVGVAGTTQPRESEESHSSSSNGDRVNQQGREDVREGDGEGSERPDEDGLDAVAGQAKEAAKSAFFAVQKEVRQAHGLEDPKGGDPTDSRDLSKSRDSVDEAEIEVLASVDYESASRLEFDRKRQRKISLTGELQPAQADHNFMAALIPLLRKASFANLSSRDDALATSLNADYVAQLFISPDTSKLDGHLVEPALKELDVPELAQSILIFKRGYGQARRKGRMLVAKLDYLQYIVVRSVTSNVVAFIKGGWNAMSGLKQIRSGKDKIDVSDQKLKPEGGRMPNSAGQGGSDGGANAANNGVELTVWQNIQKAGKSLGKSKKTPPFFVAGGGLFMTLSNWGLLPQVDVEPLENFRSAWKPDEPSRLDPVFVERTSLRDALAAESGLSPQNVLGIVELVEPTFQELLVVYRHKAKPNWLSKVRQTVMGPSVEEQSPRYVRRSPILLRIFRDVPLPAWKIVFPDKLLQFRPLDGLRADLLTVAGIVAFIAQAKYDSFILEIITLSSAIALLVRVFLGYKRMYDRFEKMANEILAETTIAGQEGVITYLANSAALQQFEQTALAYLALTSSDRPLDEEGLCNYIEELLNKEFEVKVRFDAGQALREVERLGLAHSRSNGFEACSPEEGLPKLKSYWANLLMPKDLQPEPARRSPQIQDRAKDQSSHKKDKASSSRELALRQ